MGAAHAMALPPSEKKRVHRDDRAGQYRSIVVFTKK